MDKVESLDRYKELLAETKEQCGRRLVTNSYMFLDEIRRYIDLGRLYYEKLENGIVFYSDEESHYRCYFYVNPAGTAKIEKKDKLLLAQLLYRKTKSTKELGMTEKLKEAGFFQRDIMDYITADPSYCIKKIEPLVKHIRRLLDENRLTFRTVLPSELDKVREFQNNMDNIPYYQIVYHSPEEYECLIREGRLECVVDTEGNLCALHFFDVGNGKGDGWYAIKKEYRGAYGIAMLFSYSGMKDKEKSSLEKVCGWVLRDNVESIKYHKKLGYVWEDRVMEEWTLGD